MQETRELEKGLNKQKKSFKLCDAPISVLKWGVVVVEGGVLSCCGEGGVKAAPLPFFSLDKQGAIVWQVVVLRRLPAAPATFHSAG